MLFSEMLFDRKRDAYRVEKRMRADGIATYYYREGRGKHWLRFYGADRIATQNHWEKAKAYYQGL